MKNSFNWFLAIMLVVSVALFGIGVATAGESRYSRERQEQREAAYDEGYADGYRDAPDAEIAYEEGFEVGAKAAAAYVEDAQWHTHGEEAIWALTDYFDGNATREEAEEALEWISNYYWQTEGALRELYNGDANIG